MITPIMFLVFFLWAPSGLVLYWTVSNAWAIGQQAVTNRIIGPPARPRPAAERQLKNAGAGKSVQAAARLTWLSAVVGGLLFGFGMVLGSGCGSKTLVRVGGGNLKSLVVFFVMGFAAYATLRGVLAATARSAAACMPGSSVV